MSVKERIVEFTKHINMSISAFEKQCGLSNGYFGKVNDISDKKLESITRIYPELNPVWLKMGIGEMIKQDIEIDEREKFKLNHINPEETANTIPLLPISAFAGKLNDFKVSIKESDCERIISPIKNADFALTVYGDSMQPEYQSGSQILVKKIDETAFIDWGKVYVIDTLNGTLIKKIIPSSKEGYIRCLSINPEYPPVEVPLTSVFGIYRVMLCMSMK